MRLTHHSAPVTRFYVRYLISPYYYIRNRRAIGRIFLKRINGNTTSLVRENRGMHKAGRNFTAWN